MGFPSTALGCLVGKGGRSSVGRALEWHSRGQGFDSPRLHWAGAVSECLPSLVRASMTDRDAKLAPVRSARRAGIAQLVEHNLAKVGVAGSSPVSRSVVATDATSVRE